MNKVTKTVLIIIAAILIAGGIAAAVFAVVAEKSAPADDNSSSETTETVHADIEYIYDDKGNVKSEIYYKDNVYNGRKDYYSGESAEYTTVFDKDGNEIASSVSQLNIAGSITKITSYENHVLTETVEYDYHSDLRTPTKKTVKTYEGEDEYAEKIYYAENGTKTRVCKYLNGALTEEIFYDENGNVIENGGETVEE